MRGRDVQYGFFDNMAGWPSNPISSEGVPDKSTKSQGDDQSSTTNISWPTPLAPSEDNGWSSFGAPINAQSAWPSSAAVMKGTENVAWPSAATSAKESAWPNSLVSTEVKSSLKQEKPSAKQTNFEPVTKETQYISPKPPIAPESSVNQMKNSTSIENEENEVVVRLSDIQADESSPLHSASSFEDIGIKPDILKGIYAMNFKKPSRIQEKALPLLLKNPPTNMIAQSQSGTGKTAAFLINILSRIDYSFHKSPQALILAPSRELARQLENVIKKIGSFVDNLTVQAAVPGVVSRNTAVEAIVVIGTPGTVLDLLRRRQINTQKLKILCLDEADNMLDMQGLGDQCLRVKMMLNSLDQILLFSATFPDDVLEYARRFSPKAVELTLPKDDLTVSSISQMFIDCPSDNGKYEILAQLYGLMTIGSSIIFVKRRETADRISDRLISDGHQVVSVHGAYDGHDRDRILQDFRLGKAKVLITTNVLARGIDVSTVSMVINYDIPMKGRFNEIPDAETYLHRIGRTGRFGRSGVSISFVFDSRSFQCLKEITDVYKIDLVRLDHEDWDEAEATIQRVIKTSRMA
ncbi:putative atp-dependent rna helicase dbp5 [Erysiphe necator]|uniref:RNA helicase n=1 Tax=Uncinula necator TaxID=52586 RepID=A0A0B1NZ34_UNCNE|nr:putative atp-dependent rna helicase dbp5 [Erysiphe necator]